MYKIAILVLSIIFLFIYNARLYTVSASNNIEVDFNLTKNIYLDSDELNTTYLVYKSSLSLSNYKLISECNIDSNFLQSNNNLYIFKVRYLNNNCTSKRIHLTSKKGDIVSTERLNIYSKKKLYNTFLDYNTSDLEKIQTKLNKKLLELNDYVSKNNKNRNRSIIKKKRKINEVIYISKIVEHIISKRKEKYAIPVKWKLISSDPSKVPNAWRPYRSKITDWIHHWWDVYWSLEDKTISIDDALVIRIVRDFEYSDLSKLNKSYSLSDLDKAKNLDIYRWNQVWLKTMKWDVVFYSHLTDISKNIKEWKIISKWDFIWTTGITWVPDKNYKDYHLHFTIHKNPYISTKAWKYTIDDYLLWDWYFKWESISYVLENQKRIFKDYN